MAKPIEYQCTVELLKKLTPTVFEITFSTTPALSFDAGQFISVFIPQSDPHLPFLKRAYSIASSPESPSITLCVKLIEDGPGSHYLAQLQPGHTFKMMAPYGNLTYLPAPQRHACFISTGTGIAPFRSMILSEKFKSAPPLGTYCLFGARTDDELLYQDLFSQISQAQWIPALSQPSSQWTGFRGRITHYLRSSSVHLPWLETEYYLCGHGGMIQEVKTILTEKGIAKNSIHQEIYYK